MHRDIVETLPAGAELLGFSPRCANQGMYIRNKLITVQGHPEFNEGIVTELLETRRLQGIFDEDMFQEAMTRVGRRHDGVAVGQAFLRFLLEQ